MFIYLYVGPGFFFAFARPLDGPETLCFRVVCPSVRTCVSAGLVDAFSDQLVVDF